MNEFKIPVRGYLRVVEIKSPNDDIRVQVFDGSILVHDAIGPHDHVVQSVASFVKNNYEILK